MGFPGAMKCQSMALSRQEAAMALQVNAFGVAGNLPHSSAIVQQVWTATLMTCLWLEVVASGRASRVPRQRPPSGNRGGFRLCEPALAQGCVSAGGLVAGAERMSDKKDEPARHFGIPRRLQNTDTFWRNCARLQMDIGGAGERPLATLAPTAACPALRDHGVFDQAALSPWQSFSDVWIPAPGSSSIEPHERLH